jgi:hypothetical protein
LVAKTVPRGGIDVGHVFDEVCHEELLKVEEPRRRDARGLGLGCPPGRR